jgi:hypothetical protein
MGQVKPWQVVVLVAALVALGVSVYFTMFSGPRLELADSVRMADVNSGELFRLKIGPGGAMIPGTNPKTKAVSLLPIEERDGKWFISERYLSALKGLEGEHKAVLDAKTGEIRVQAK